MDGHCEQLVVPERYKDTEDKPHSCLLNLGPPRIELGISASVRSLLIHRRRMDFPSSSSIHEIIIHTCDSDAFLIQTMNLSKSLSHLKQRIFKSLSIYGAILNSQQN